MKKSLAIILTFLAVVLCACPNLIFGVITLSQSPEWVSMIIASGQQATGINAPPSDLGTSIAVARVVAGSAICLGLVIPVAVGLITFGMARKQAAQNL
jgi:hypothetical protein